MDGTQRQRLVVESAEHHDRNMRCGGMNRLECLQAAAVWQRKVEQNQVNIAVCKTLESSCQAIRPAQRDGSRTSTGLAQHLEDQPRIARVVFDQQRANGCCVDAHDWRGNVTIVSQKSSMDLTTVMNCSRSTGLVM